MLAAATLIVKIIGILYKIPLSNMVGAVGRGYFDSAYNLYIPVYTISMAGLPVAISKMVSQQMALKRYRDVRLTFKVAARLFLITGQVMVILRNHVTYWFFKYISMLSKCQSHLSFSILKTGF